MKRLAVTGAMLAIMVAGGVPAFASATAGDVTVDVMRAPQFQFAAALQTQQGDATATSGNVGSAADAAIDQSLTIDQWQWNGGF